MALQRSRRGGKTRRSSGGGAGVGMLALPWGMVALDRWAAKRRGRKKTRKTKKGGDGCGAPHDKPQTKGLVGGGGCKSHKQRGKSGRKHHKHGRKHTRKHTRKSRRR